MLWWNGGKRVTLLSAFPLTGTRLNQLDTEHFIIAQHERSREIIFQVWHDGVGQDRIAAYPGL